MPSGARSPRRRRLVSDGPLERVARAELARLEPCGEPVLTLFRRSVRPGLRVHLPLRLALDAVVPDRACGVERGCDVRLRHTRDESGLLCVISPDSREAVGLELRPDRAALWALPTAGLRLLECPREILHMVTVLVRQHVRLGERSAARAELGAEDIEEPEVDVHVLVDRAIERADVAARAAAARVRRAREEDGLGDLVLRERLRPEALHAVDDANDAAVLARVRIGAGAAALGEVGRRLHGACCTTAAERLDQDEGNDNQEPYAAPADRHRPSRHAHARAGTAAVLDLRRVEPGVLAKAHGEPSARRARFYALSQEPCVQWPNGRT